MPARHRPAGYGPPGGGYGEGGGYGRSPGGYGPPPSGPGGYGGAPPSGPRHHAGLGSRGAPSNLPPPPNLAGSPGGYGSPAVGGAAGALGMQGPAGEKFSLFVGSIVDGLENGWLESILGVAGPVLSFRRPSPPFAFVEYAEAESVLRCLEVVNGAAIKMPNGAEKTLLVKADEKTRGRLDEYEKDRENDDLTQQAKDDLANILRRIAAGDPISGTEPEEHDPERKPHIPQHLKDLAPEDLPESHRNNTLSSIAQFREAAVKKAHQRFELDRQIEERRQAMIAQNARQHQQRAAPGYSPPGPAAGPSHVMPAASQDPQSFNRPVPFVAGGAGANGAPAPQAEPELDDMERERERAEAEHRQQEVVYRNRERQFEQRERARIAAWEREQAREQGIAEQEERDRAYMAERLATWDDDREAERGRELFYIDRIRWRAQRKPHRLREQEADARDRAFEAQQVAALNEQSDSFLSQHADLFASSLPTPGTPASGADTASATPGGATPAVGVKLNLTTAPKPVVKEAPKPRPTAMALADEEEEGRKKRELIPLEYSDDEDAGQPRPRLSRSEMERKAREIEAKVPTSKDGLWVWKVRWKRLNDDIIKRRITPYANRLIVDYLGGEEAELLNVVNEYLRDHKGPQALLEELEPVLDEDVTNFVVKVWRRLAIETEFEHAGIDF
ncbi:hypothetical protein NBRC10512v2_002309 [Rhodotorula toruloides]